MHKDNLICSYVTGPDTVHTTSTAAHLRSQWNLSCHGHLLLHWFSWASDSRADTMVQPAAGPSLGVAPWSKGQGEGDTSTTAQHWTCMHVCKSTCPSLLNSGNVQQLAALRFTSCTDHACSVLNCGMNKCEVASRTSYTGHPIQYHWVHSAFLVTKHIHRYQFYHVR